VSRLRGRAVPAALASTAVSGIWALATAAPASASVCELDIGSPSPGFTSPSPNVSVTGAFEVSEAVVEALRAVEVTFLESPGDRPAPVTRSGAGVGDTGRYEVPLGPLTRNGRYTVRVTATHPSTPVLTCDGQAGTSSGQPSRSADVSFSVSVRAQAPTNVRAALDAGPRTVTVTWAKSSDPDIAGYTVSRKVGSAAPTGVAVPPEPLSWTDRDLPAGAATITYSVQAVRKGAVADTTSEPSPAVSATLDVPARPPGPTTARAPAVGGTATTKPFVPGPAASGATSPAAPAAPALELPAGVGGPGDPPSITDLEADGYQSQLQDPADVGGSAEEGREQALVGSDEGGGGGGIPSMVYVASGLLGTVVAAQLLWRRREGPGAEPVVATAIDPPLEALGAPAPAAPPDPTSPDGDPHSFAPPQEAGGSKMRSSTSGPPDLALGQPAAATPDRLDRPMSASPEPAAPAEPQSPAPSTPVPAEPGGSAPNPASQADVRDQAPSEQPRREQPMLILRPFRPEAP